MYREAHGRVAFIGEGQTDRYGALYADVVFAKDALPAYCEADGVPYLPWEHFDDIRRTLEALEALPGAGRSGSLSRMDAPLDLTPARGPHRAARHDRRPRRGRRAGARVRGTRLRPRPSSTPRTSSWTGPGPGTDLAVMSVAVFDGDTMVAEAEAFQGRGEVNIHPDHRGRGIGTAILPWLHEVARSQGPTLAPDRARHRHRPGASSCCATATGRPSRRGSSRSRSRTAIEPPVLPAGFAFRDFRPGVDDRETYQVIEDAFSEWEGRPAVTFEDWAGLTIGRESFDPSNMLLAVDEGTDEIVGVVFMIDYGIEDGWIQQVATKATHRHRGIARALLHRAFQVLRRAGQANGGAQHGLAHGRAGPLREGRDAGLQLYTNYVKDLD